MLQEDFMQLDNPEHPFQNKPQSHTGSPEIVVQALAEPRAELALPPEYPNEESATSDADSSKQVTGEELSLEESKKTSSGSDEYPKQAGGARTGGFSSKKPVSDRKRRANRKNATKSTGPTSARGKRTSSRNAVKHGILANDIVNRDLGESQAVFDRLLRELLAEWQPVGRREEKDVLKIARTTWRLRRVYRAENGEITKGVNGSFHRMLRDRREKFEQDRLQWEVMRAKRHFTPGQDRKSCFERAEEVDKIIRNLRSTIDGLDFVITAANVIKDRVESREILSTQDHMFLLDLFGIDAMDLPSRDAHDDADDTTLPDESSEDENCENESPEDDESQKRDLQIVLDYIDYKLSECEGYKKFVESANEREFRGELWSLNVPPPTASSTLVRYESSLERKLNRDEANLERRQTLRKKAVQA
jgi:hypothetical protein